LQSRMGLRTELERCEHVVSSSVSVPESSRTDADVVNLAIRSMIGDPIQRSALAIVCKRVPILKPFVLMFLQTYIASCTVHG
jgi:hypothetical protein